MYKINFLVAAFVGVTVYVCFSIFFGPEGIVKYRALEKQKQLLLQNIHIIQTINENLAIDYISLRSDSDVIAAHAKKLGYIHEGEKIIKLTGIPYTTSIAPEAGTAISIEKTLSSAEWVTKLLGILAFAFILIFSVLAERKIK